MARKRTKLGMGAEELAKLRQRVRTATDPREKERLQVVLWASSGEHTLEQLAQLVGRARSTVQIWLGKFEQGGLPTLLRRDAPPGLSSPLGAPAIQGQLKEGLRKGRWRSAGQVAAWLKATHGIERAAKSLYYWLGKVGGALRVPRPCHVKKDPAAAAAFRDGLVAVLEGLGLPKERPVKVWVADESRFGLHVQTRRCWALRGERVVVPREHCYVWEYVYGALEVVEGDAQFRFMPSVQLDFSRDFLRQIAESDPRAEHVVIWDQAGFHPPPQAVGVPERIHLLALPAYSPELNPVEGLWDQIQDVTCNRLFADLEALEAVLTEALRPFWETRSRVLSLVHHWLHAQANSIA